MLIKIVKSYNHCNVHPMSLTYPHWVSGWKAEAVDRYWPSLPRHHMLALTLQVGSLSIFSILSIISIGQTCLCSIITTLIASIAVRFLASVALAKWSWTHFLVYSMPLKWKNRKHVYSYIIMCVYISSIFCRRSIRIMDALICYRNIINMLVNYIQLSLYTCKVLCVGGWGEKWTPSVDGSM